MTQFHTLTVYLGSSGHARPVFGETAEKLGQIIGDSGKSLVYGGMDAGLMGTLAASAMKAGALVTGIVPQKLKDSERILDNIDETILVPDLWERKLKMFNRADAIITLPGGFGTLDETLEALYWGSLGLHNKPVALVNIEGYWDKLITYLHTLPDFKPEYLIIVDDIADLMEALAASPLISDLAEQDENKFPHFEDEILEPQQIPIILHDASLRLSYMMVTALGLKQLGKHGRPIGFLNDAGQFDALLKWFKTAEQEKFITEKCLGLYAAHENEVMLQAILDNQDTVAIDLHVEKWGERRKNPRD